MSDPVGERYTGARVRRLEDPRILTGRGRYVDDVVLPDMVHAAFLRSPYPHARITAIDASSAREAPGVVAVYTGLELESLIVPGAYGMAGAAGRPAHGHSLLATDKVRLVGDLVALVVAEDRYLAEDACELIEVDYELLPAIATVAQGCAPGAPLVFEDLGSNLLAEPEVHEYGDVDGAFAAAARVVTATIKQHRHQNVPLETRGIVASVDSSTGRVTVHTSNQAPHYVAAGLAARLGVPVEDVRVLVEDVGGSFGLKAAASREDVAVAVAAGALGRPVKWIEDRTEHLQASGHAREEEIRVDAAVSDAGAILGLRARMVVDTGAYPGMGLMLGPLVESMFPSAYRIPALSFESAAVVTNKASYVAYRGPWAVETFVRERMIDLIARELELEPAEVRLRNVVEGNEDDRMITGRTLHGCTARQSILAAVEHIDLPGFRRRQRTARTAGRYLGLGLATFIEPAPGPRNGGPLGAETVRIRVGEEGGTELYTAQMPSGQAHQTTYAQVAADAIGARYDDVRVVVGDTDVVPFGITAGSRGATMAGGATVIAARTLKERLLDAAAHVFEANRDDLLITDGQVHVRGVPSRSMSLGALVAAARVPGALPPELDTEFEVSHTYDGGAGGWSGGTHAVIVEVDIETGVVSIERYLVVEDCGEVINPAVVEGQVRGGVVQGIGAVLLEHAAYDEASGQHLASTFVDYLLPTTTEVPHIEVHHLESEPLDPEVNFRGVGEGGMIAAPAAVVNAIDDALSPFGVRLLEQHLPPGRILELLGTIDVA